MAFKYKLKLLAILLASQVHRGYIVTLYCNVLRDLKVLYVTRYLR